MSFNYNCDQISRINASLLERKDHIFMGSTENEGVRQGYYIYCLMMTRKKVSSGSLGNSSVISSSRLPIYNPEQQANVITIVFQLQLPIPLFM